VRLPVALWCLGPGNRMIPAAWRAVGSGRASLRSTRRCRPPTPAWTRPCTSELAVGLSLAGEGAGLLTAASVTDAVQCEDDEVRAAATDVEAHARVEDDP
jgi:hypothetical protein